MKRIIAFATIALVGLGIASPSGAVQPQKTSAGSGQTSTGWTITYNGTVGSGDLGEFDAVSPGGTHYHGEVTCVSITSSTTATLYGYLTDGPGGDWLLSVRDLGNGKSKHGNLDQIAIEINPDEAPGCSDPADGFVNVVSGNLQVKA